MLLDVRVLVAKTNQNHPILFSCYNLQTIQPNKFPTRVFCFLLLAGLVFAQPVNATNYYVATNGNDSAAGTLARPFKTLQNAFNTASAGDTIYVRSGTYREAVSLVGISGSAGAPITLTSYTNESAILSGLDVQTLTWTTNSGISNVWVTTYTNGAFEQMFVDGKPMLEARWPNVPTNADGSWNFFSSNVWATVDTNGNSYGTVKDSTLAATGWNITGWRAVLNVSHQYYTWTRIVTNHIAGSSIFKYPQDLGSSAATSSQSFNDDRYYLVGNTNLLDSPGEWCYDANSQRLYFYPFNGKNPNTSTVEIKSRNYSFTADQNSSYLTVAGITFWGTAFQFGTSVDNRSKNIIFKNNQALYSSWTEWLNMTNNDLHVLNDNNFPQIFADNSQILNNTFANGALSALYVFGWTNLIENNVFHDFDLSSSLVYPPLVIGNAIIYNDGKYGNATVRYNSIYNGGGVLAQIVGTNTQAYLNDLHDAFRACWGGNIDTSALYNTTQSGLTNNLNTRFHHNWVHEGFSGAPNPAWGGGLGIRGDDNTVGLTVDHNVTWDLGGAGIQIKNVTNPIPAQANACINNTVFNYSVLYTATNGAIYINNSEGGNENLKTSVANNLADSIYGNWGAMPLGALALYASNSIGVVTETNLENIGWCDFRPQAAATNNIINHGITNAYATNFVGSAPDIGAYERGDTRYFIPGQRSTNATFPIVPNGAVVATNRDVLMWRPAYNAASHTVYFGASPGALTNAGTFGGETNVFILPALSAGQFYYWRVDAVMTNAAVVTGNVWSFSTVASPAIWDGGSTIDANWMSATNWNPNVIPATNGTEVLTFVGTNRTTTTNNFATNTAFAGINFSNTVAAQAFTLNGNPIALNGNIILTATAGTINDTNAIALMLTGDCTITANTNHNLLVSSIISDDGGARSLTKDGAATLSLINNSNSFSGTMIVRAGILSVSSISNGMNSAIGNSTSAIQLGGGGVQLTYTGSGGTISRAISLTGTGSSTFNSSGSGAVVYNGAFTGYNGGALQLSGSNTGSNDWQTAITTAGTSVGSVGGNWKVSGAIQTGSGGLYNYWTGTLFVNNDANNFTGTIAVTAGGTISFTSITNQGIASSLGAYGTGNGTITLGNTGDGTLNYVGTLAGGHATDRQIKISNSTTAVGNARINANGAGALIWTMSPFNVAQSTWTVSHTLTLGGTNTGANEIQGTIVDNSIANSKTGLIKTDAGTWILSGTNTYSGPTTVSGGTLLINRDSSGATNIVTVASGATLGGSGKIGGAVTLASGAFATNVIGFPLTVTNGLTLNNNTIKVATTNLLGAGNYLLITNTKATAISGTFYTNVVVGGVGVSGTPSIVTTTNAVFLTVAASTPGGGTNITFIQTSGGKLILQWPNGQGWKLQAQTNKTGGLTTNWYDTGVAFSPFTNTADKTNKSVFYRLKYP